MPHLSARAETKNISKSHPQAQSIPGHKGDDPPSAYEALMCKKVKGKKVKELIVTSCRYP